MGSSIDEEKFFPFFFLLVDDFRDYHSPASTHQIQVFIDDELSIDDIQYRNTYDGRGYRVVVENSVACEIMVH